MGEVVELNFQFWAKCEACGGNRFLLALDGPGTDWQTVIGTVCVNCENMVDWVKASKEDTQHRPKGGSG